MKLPYPLLPNRSARLGLAAEPHRTGAERRQFCVWGCYFTRELRGIVGMTPVAAAEVTKAARREQGAILHACKIDCEGTVASRNGQWPAVCLVGEGTLPGAAPPVLHACKSGTVGLAGQRASRRLSAAPRSPARNGDSHVVVLHACKTRVEAPGGARDSLSATSPTHGQSGSTARGRLLLHACKNRLPRGTEMWSPGDAIPAMTLTHRKDDGDELILHACKNGGGDGLGTIATGDSRDLKMPRCAKVSSSPGMADRSEAGRGHEGSASAAVGQEGHLPYNALTLKNFEVVLHACKTSWRWKLGGFEATWSRYALPHAHADLGRWAAILHACKINLATTNGLGVGARLTDETISLDRSDRFGTVILHACKTGVPCEMVMWAPGVTPPQMTFASRKGDGAELILHACKVTRGIDRSKTPGQRARSTVCGISLRDSQHSSDLACDWLHFHSIAIHSRQPLAWATAEKKDCTPLRRAFSLAAGEVSKGPPRAALLVHGAFRPGEGTFESRNRRGAH